MSSLIGSSAMAVEEVPEMAARLRQDYRSSGKFVVIRQVKPGSQSTGQGQDQVRQP